MDEGNVGKDLAVREKIDDIVQRIKNGEDLEREESIILVKGIGIPLSVKRDEEEGSHKINILGAHILTLEDEELSFTQGWEENLRAKTEGIIDAEDLIDQLKEMEISLIRQKEEQQQRDSNEGEERGASNEKGEEEKPKIEEEEPEKEDGDEEKQPLNKKFPKKDSGWIEIKSDRETDEMRTFYGMIKKEYPNHVQGAERFFIAPNPKDANDYNLYTTDAQGNVVNEIPLEHTEGKNPMDEDVLTYGKDGSDSKTQQPVQILKIGNSVNGAMLVITKGTRTGTQVHIGNRSRGDDYNAHQISSSLSQKEIMDAGENVREGTSSSYGEREQGSAEKKYYETLEKLDKQGVPEEANPAKDGISVGEIEVNSMDELTASLAAVFAKEYGLSKECAMNVATGVIEEGKDFKDALEAGFEIEEKAGRIAPGSAEKRAEQTINYSNNGPEREEEEPQKLPGQGLRSGM